MLTNEEKLEMFDIIQKTCEEYDIPMNNIDDANQLWHVLRYGETVEEKIMTTQEYELLYIFGCVNRKKWTKIRRDVLRNDLKITIPFEKYEHLTKGVVLSFKKPRSKEIKEIFLGFKEENVNKTMSGLVQLALKGYEQMPSDYKLKKITIVNLETTEIKNFRYGINIFKEQYWRMFNY